MIGVNMTNYSKYSNKNKKNNNETLNNIVEKTDSNSKTETTENINKSLDIPTEEEPKLKAETSETINIETESLEVTNETATVNCDFLNLRKEADKNSDIVHVLTKKTVVEVLGKTDEWTNVKYNNYVGYVMSKFII